MLVSSPQAPPASRSCDTKGPVAERILWLGCVRVGPGPPAGWSLVVDEGVPQSHEAQHRTQADSGSGGVRQRGLCGGMCIEV